MNTYIEGWRLGLKAIAIYRDGSKRSAPLEHAQDQRHGRRCRRGADRADGSTSNCERRIVELDEEIAKLRVAARPAGAPSHARHAHVVHPQVRDRRPRGLHHRRPFEDGQPGELFIQMTKEGSTIGGLMDTVGDAHLDVPAVRRAAREPGEEIRLPALRAERVSPRIPISATPAASPITSSAGSAASSSRATRKRPRPAAASPSCR